MDPLLIEFEAGLSRAKLSFPPERKAAMFEAFLGYRALASLLDEALPEALEPAGLYIPPCGDKP